MQHLGEKLFDQSKGMPARPLSSPSGKNSIAEFWNMKWNAHLNAKVMEALFVQSNSVTARFDHHEVETERRKKKVIIIMFLG